MQNTKTKNLSGLNSQNVKDAISFNLNEIHLPDINVPDESYSEIKDKLKSLSISIVGTVHEIDAIIAESEKKRISDKCEIDKITSDLILKAQFQKEAALCSINKIEEMFNLVIPTYTN
jgi:hypothetical protein